MLLNSKICRDTLDWLNFVLFFANTFTNLSSYQLLPMTTTRFSPNCVHKIFIRFDLEQHSRMIRPKVFLSSAIKFTGWIASVFF